MGRHRGVLEELQELEVAIPRLLTAYCTRLNMFSHFEVSSWTLEGCWTLEILLFLSRDNQYGIVGWVMLGRAFRLPSYVA